MDSRDNFDDLNLGDQFIPLEQLEYTLSPFNPTLNTLKVSLYKLIKIKINFL